MIRADVRLGHAFRLEPAQAFEEQALAESSTLIIGVRAHRLEMANPGQLVCPDDAVSSNVTVGRNDEDLMLLHIDRRLHQTPGAGPICFEIHFRPERRV